MKDKFENIDSVLCDKLFNFIYLDENNMTDEEIQAELQKLKIDTRPAMDKIHFALTKASERKHAQESLDIQGGASSMYPNLGSQEYRPYILRWDTLVELASRIRHD